MSRHTCRCRNRAGILDQAQATRERTIANPSKALLSDDYLWKHSLKPARDKVSPRQHTEVRERKYGRRTEESCRQVTKSLSVYLGSESRFVSLAPLCRLRHVQQFPRNYPPPPFQHARRNIWTVPRHSRSFFLQEGITGSRTTKWRQKRIAFIIVSWN